MKKRIIPSALIAAVIAATVLTGCGKSNDGQASSSAENTAVTYVEVLNTSEDTIKSEYLYSGTIKPVNEVTVSGTVQGKVASVNFDVGDYVNAGDVLYSMDTADILNSKRVAEASLSSAEANIQSAQTNLDLVNGASMQNQIDSAKAALDKAEVAYNTAKTNYDNNKVLFDNGIISQTEMDNITDTYTNAEIAYNQAKDAYDLTMQMPEENRRKAEDALNIAKASKDSVIAQINSYNQSLADAVVKSPISGYVTARNVDAGTVLASAEPFKISDTSKVTMNVSVSEEIINSIITGETVSVSIPSVSDVPKVGTITTINPAANAGGTYDVEIEIDNADGNLKSGMFGEVNFIKDESDNTIVLPVDAVITKGGETYVFIMKDNKAVKTPVQTGIENGNEVEITSGLTENMDVVVKGQTYLEDGDSIAVAPETDSDDTENNKELLNGEENASDTSSQSSSSAAASSSAVSSADPDKKEE